MKKGKSEMYAYLAQRQGVAFVNLEESHLTSLADERKVQRRISYHLSSHPDLSHPNYEIKPLEISPNISVAFLGTDGETQTVQSNLSGKHNLQNIITAIAVGKYFKVPAKDVVIAIEGYIPKNNRSQWLEKGETKYYLDAYNANPSSMKASLQNFAGMKGKPKWAILGDMLELGEVADKEHAELIHFAKTLNIDHLILVGPHFEAIAEELSVPHFSKVESLKNSPYLQQWEGSLVFIKGSRGIRLEELLKDS